MKWDCSCNSLTATVFRYELGWVWNILFLVPHARESL